MSRSHVAKRFRGFLPVVVDIETGGFNSDTDAVLEIAAVFVNYHPDSGWYRDGTISHHVAPFEGANIEEAAIAFNKIDPYHPFRLAVDEREALSDLFEQVSHAVKEHGCSRAILVGHNPAFDLSFLKAAAKRERLKKTPFHHFSTFDTASLAGVALGQTVLARAVEAAGFSWDGAEAHSAIYDAERTADLFCEIVNRWDRATKAG